MTNKKRRPASLSFGGDHCLLTKTAGQLLRLLSLLLFPCNDGGLVVLSLSSSSFRAPPPPAARPVVVGTATDYSNVLFGKLQRAGNLFGTNLGQPLGIVEEGDGDILAKKLEKCLWNQFSMANVGADGVLEQADLTRPLSDWIPQANLKDALVFFDLASPIVPKKKGLLSGNLMPSLPSLPFFNDSNKNKNGKKEENQVVDMEEEAVVKQKINLDVLKCAVERQCAHIYVLATSDTLENCQSALLECASEIPSTIVYLQEGLKMIPTQGWVSSREQNMDGNFVTSMKLQKRRNNEGQDNDTKMNPNSITSSKSSPKMSIPLEDVAEIMIQISLRTERDNVESSPKVVQLSPTSGVEGDGYSYYDDINNNSNNGNNLIEKPNSDYFTMMGGSKMKELSGTVKTVASWENLLSPLGGKINADLCYRPDKLT